MPDFNFGVVQVIPTGRGAELHGALAHEGNAFAKKKRKKNKRQSAQRGADQVAELRGDRPDRTGLELALAPTTNPYEVHQSVRAAAHVRGHAEQRNGDGEVG